MGKIAIILNCPRQPFRTKRNSIGKNWSKIINYLWTYGHSCLYLKKISCYIIDNLGVGTFVRAMNCQIGKSPWEWSDQVIRWLNSQPPRCPHTYTQTYNMTVNMDMHQNFDALVFTSKCLVSKRMLTPFIMPKFKASPYFCFINLQCEPFQAWFPLFTVTYSRGRLSEKFFQ